MAGTNGLTGCESVSMWSSTIELPRRSRSSGASGSALLANCWNGDGALGAYEMELRDLRAASGRLPPFGRRDAPAALVRGSAGPHAVVGERLRSARDVRLARRVGTSGQAHAGQLGVDWATRARERRASLGRLKLDRARVGESAGATWPDEW